VPQLHGFGLIGGMVAEQDVDMAGGFGGLGQRRVAGRACPRRQTRTRRQPAQRQLAGRNADCGEAACG
jgi:hypothetical protein